MEKAPGCGDQRHSLLKMALMFRLQACSLIPLYSLFPSVPASGDSKLSCRLTAPSRLNVRQGKACHLKHIDHGAGGLLRHPQGYFQSLTFFSFLGCTSFVGHRMCPQTSAFHIVLLSLVGFRGPIYQSGL